MLRTALKYYATVLFILYSSALAIRVLNLSNVLTRDPNAVLALNGSLLLAISAVAYRLKDGKFLGLLGFKREGLWRSLVYSGAALGIATVPIALFHRVSPSRIVQMAIKHASSGGWPVWMNHTSPMLLPAYAVVIWGISGILFLSLLIAYPYEILGARYLPFISFMFTITYNLPLLTGEWVVDDVVVLGILFPVLYHMTRNSLGLIISYVLLYEYPVLVSFLKGWGMQAFVLLLFGRVIWEISCLITVTFYFLCSRIFS